MIHQKLNNSVKLLSLFGVQTSGLSRLTQQTVTSIEKHNTHSQITHTQVVDIWL